MTTSYTVSGSIVLHNNKSNIEATLHSLKEHTTGVPFQLYLIDNASADGSPELAAAAWPEAELLRNEKNLGFGAGHNRVLHRLNSKYHAFINPDVLLSSDAITSMAQYMDAHEDVVLLSPRIVFPETGEDQILGKRNPTLRYLVASRLRGKLGGKALREYAMRDEDLSLPFEIENATGCFMLVRTADLRAIGGFDEQFFLYFEDCDLTRSLVQRGRVLYYPDAVIQHVWGRESKKNAWLAMVQVSSMLKYFRKWRHTCAKPVNCAAAK
ncbi:MAG: glycosyltransferase family 2 protein [Oscillospiraceae bacterium]|jgi:GT2 family glycosyltransferase|nr:glycosyltransferase family 2 protein [Oscillospiraceae bacterium]